MYDNGPVTSTTVPGIHLGFLVVKSCTYTLCHFQWTGLNDLWSHSSFCFAWLFSTFPDISGWNKSKWDLNLQFINISHGNTRCRVLHISIVKKKPRQFFVGTIARCTFQTSFYSTALSAWPLVVQDGRHMLDPDLANECLELYYQWAKVILVIWSLNVQCSTVIMLTNKL